jgi:hypothetical protein
MDHFITAHTYFATHSIKTGAMGQLSNKKILEADNKLLDKPEKL